MTVAIPNYNGGKNLERAIRSCKNLALEQHEFEILVVDNQSKDDSWERVQAMKEEKFSNIRFEENQRNLGRVPNWNRCIEEARGEYLLFLFVREQISPENNFAELIEKIRSEDADLGKSQHRNLSEEHESSESSFESFSMRDEVRSQLAQKGFISLFPLQTFVFDTELLTQNNITFDEDYEIFGDQDFIIKIGRNAYRSGKKCNSIRTNKDNIIWDDTQDRFDDSFGPTDSLDELLDWYVEKNVGDYTGISGEELAQIRLSRIRLINVAHSLTARTRFKEASLASRKRNIIESRIGEGLDSPFLPFLYPRTLLYMVKKSLQSLRGTNE